MKSIKQTIGYLQSAWKWGVLGLVLALVVTLGSVKFASAQTLRTINLNTGFDQWASSPTLIPVSGLDNEWRVVVDPTNPPPSPPSATGRPADVVDGSVWVGLNSQLPTNFPSSRWISINSNAQAPQPPPSTPYDYAYYFTLPPGFSNAQLTMKLSSDDHITNVTLNGNVLFQGSGGIFINPPLPISSTVQSHFTSGSTVNVITVTVEDTAGSPTGLIVDGTVTYEDCDRPAIKDIPHLESITFFEGTGALTPFTFALNSSGQELQARLTDPLSSPLNRDFEGWPVHELYDVFISSANGVVDPTGQFVTIEAVFDQPLPSGGGLNIAAVRFDFTASSGLPPQFANFVSSFVALGNNAMPNDVVFAVDGNLLTATTMGNTIGQTTQRLRVTVGFPCCATPPPGMVAWWPLDEATGATAVNDIASPPSSIVNNMGTPQPGGAVGSDAPNAVTGQVNGALHFYPYHFVQVPDQAELNFGKFSGLSIDAWVKPVQFSPTLLQPIVDKLAVPFPLPSPPTGTGLCLVH